MRSRAAVRGDLQSDGRATFATRVAVPRVGLGRGWKGVCKRAGREPARHSPPFLMSLHIYERATLATCVARPQSAAPCKATGELRLRHAYPRRASFVWSGMEAWVCSVGLHAIACFRCAVWAFMPNSIDAVPTAGIRPRHVSHIRISRPSRLHV